MRYVAEALTDIGKKRLKNEDAFLIDAGAQLFAVADGMGGMDKGEFASNIALNMLPDLLRRKNLKPDESPVEISSSLKIAIFKLSQLVRSEVGELSGTTLVMALGLGIHLYIASIGDSRAYLHRGGNLQRLTKDHNMASLLVDYGKITPEEAMNHPSRNLLTMYLGIERAAAEVKVIIPEGGDRFLLCSDGLTSTVKDKDISRVIQDQRDQKAALEELIAMANEVGGKDNITALIIDCYAR